MPSNNASRAPTGVCLTPTTQTNPTYSNVRHLETSNDPRHISSSTRRNGRQTETFEDLVFHPDKKEISKENSLGTADQRSFSPTKGNGQTEPESDLTAHSRDTEKSNSKSNRSVGRVPNRTELEASSGTSFAVNGGLVNNAIQANSLESNEHKMEHIHEGVSRIASPVGSSCSHIPYHPTPRVCREHSFAVRNLRADFDTVPDRKDLRRKDTISWIHASQERVHQASSTISPSESRFPSQPEESEGVMSVDASPFPQWVSPGDRRHSHRSSRRNLAKKPFRHSTPIPGVKMRRPADEGGKSADSPNARASPLIKGSKKWWRTPRSAHKSWRGPPSWAGLETPERQTESEDLSSTLEVTHHPSHFTCEDLVELRNGCDNPMAGHTRDIPSEVRSDRCVHNIRHSTPRRKHTGRYYSEPESLLQSENGCSVMEREPTLNTHRGSSSLLSGTLPSSLRKGTHCSDPAAECDGEPVLCFQPFAQTETSCDDHEMYRRYLETKRFAHSPPVREYSGKVSPSGEYSHDASTADDNVHQDLNTEPLAHSTPVSKDGRRFTENQGGGLSEDLVYDIIRSRNIEGKPFGHSTPLSKDSRMHTVECREALREDGMASRSLETKPYPHSKPMRKRTKHRGFREGSPEETTQLSLGTTAGTDDTHWKYYRAKSPSHISSDFKGRRRWRNKAPGPVLSGACHHCTREPPAKPLGSTDGVVKGRVPPAPFQTKRESGGRQPREFSFGEYLATLAEVAGRRVEDTKRQKRLGRDGTSKREFDFGDYCERLHGLIRGSKKQQWRDD